MNNKEREIIINNLKGFKQSLTVLKSRMTEDYMDVMHLYKNINMLEDCVSNLKRKEHGRSNR